MRRVWRVLRSRKVAALTIGAFAVYAMISTMVVSEDYAAPYGSPLFLALAGFLALSTAACAWERTLSALSDFRRVDDAGRQLALLRERPTFVVSTSLEPDVATSVTADAFRRLGLSVKASDGVLAAHGGLLGRIGSAVFHWSLTLLFVVICAGELTQSVGYMRIIEGGAREAVPESYTGLDAGPLASKAPGFSIAVPGIDMDYQARGLDQGPTPIVEVRSSDGDIMARGHAYPNHPVRAGTVTVHPNDYGLAVVVEVATQSGVESADIFLEYTEDRSAVVPNGFEIQSPDGSAPTRVLFELPENRSDDQGPAVSVRAGVGGLSSEGSGALHAILEPGETMSLPGAILTIDRLTRYAKLTVVNDWSVLPIYVLFGTALIGLTAALWAPPRRCWAACLEEDPACIRVRVSHRRGDPVFADRVASAISRSTSDKEPK